MPMCTIYPPYRWRDRITNPTSAVTTSVPVAPRRTCAPRTNSCPIVPMTKAHRAKHSPDTQTLNPIAYSPTAVTTAHATGQANW